MAQHVIETVMFKLNAGENAAGFVEAAKAMGSWVQSQPGFLHRRLSCTEDGTWIEHIEWSDMEAAQAAAAQIGAEPGNADFLKAIDGPTVKMMHSHLEVTLD